MARARFGIAWRSVLESAGPLVAALLALWIFDGWASHHIDDYVYGVFRLCGIMAIAAVSLNIVLGLTGQFSIGHAGFMAVGAYTASLITTAAGGDLSPHVGLTSQLIFLAATVLGGIAAGIAGWLVGVPSLRLKGDYLAIVTLGFGEIIRSIIENTPALGGAIGISGIPMRATGFWVFGWLVVVVLFSRRLLQSTHGRALLAVREDEIAAEAMGIDTTEYKVRAFVVSSFFAGVSGALLAHYIQAITPGLFKFDRSIAIVTMVVLGGMGSTTGAVLTAFGLTALPEVARGLQSYRNVFTSIILVLVMLLRPKGLLGRWEIWRLWEKERKPAPDEGAAGEALLSVQKATIRFGGLTAVKEFSVELRPRELVALIGPNGAGKTTVFNLLTGVYQPTEGSIRVSGRSTRGLVPSQIAGLGAARTFQNIRLFKQLTVFDNVRIACHHLTRQTMAAAIRRGEIFSAEEEWISERAEELLKVMGLAHRRDEIASSLPYGEQRRLEIARALATGPKVLLLDEPAAGMNTREKSDLMALIRDIRDRFGVAILLIEHDMKLVMGVSERIIVLDHGETIAQGTPKEIQTNPRVIEAYLGAETVAGHAPTTAVEAG
jgi:branched-chain amino acid transport system permease protein